MLKREENDLIWEKYLLESPWHNRYGISKLNDMIEDVSVEDVRKKLDKAENFHDVEVYQEHKESNIEQYYISHDTIIAYCVIEISGSYPSLKLIWNRPENKGIFRKIIVDYLLPKYKVLESGDNMTDMGFDFFKKLMRDNPQLKFYVNRDGGIIKVNEPEEFHQHKEGLSHKGNHSTFVISYE